MKSLMNYIGRMQLSNISGLSAKSGKTLLNWLLVSYLLCHGICGVCEGAQKKYVSVQLAIDNIRYENSSSDNGYSRATLNETTVSHFTPPPLDRTVNFGPYSQKLRMELEKEYDLTMDTISIYSGFVSLSLNMGVNCFQILSLENGNWVPFNECPIGPNMLKKIRVLPTHQLIIVPPDEARTDESRMNGLPWMMADGQSQAVASVPGIDISGWEIVGEAFGCRIASMDYCSAIITAGERSGIITVRATGSGGCVHEAELELVSCDACNDCLNFGSMKAGNDQGPDIRLGLGGADYQKYGGYMRLSNYGQAPTAALFSPSSLAVFSTMASGQETIVQNGQVRQIKVPTGLIDIQVTAQANNTVTEYVIRNYDSGFQGKVNGLYQISTSAVPMSRYTIRNLDTTGGTFNQFQISERRGDATTDYVSYQYTYTASENKWVMEDSAGLAKVTSKYESVSNEWREYLTIGKGTNAPVYAAKKTYLTINGRKLLHSILEGDETNPNEQRVTTYQYNSNGMETERVQSDGRWIRYQYDTSNRVLKQLEPYGDNQGPTDTESLCKVTEYRYSLGTIDNGTYLPLEPRQIIVKIKGQVVSCHLRSLATDIKMEQQCYTLSDQNGDYSSNWNNSNNLVTKTFYDTDGRVKAMLKTDQTVTINQYSANGYLETVMEGQPDSITNPTSIQNGIKTVFAFGPKGELL